MKVSEKGKAGEDHVSRYLADKGYRILSRRFRSPAGEVDIVAKEGDNLVFCEVKTWDRAGAEALETSVDHRKRQRIRGAASYFLSRHPELSGCRIRFDLIFLSGRMGALDHWESAF